ncbi:hypothetical protein P154DRAFT_107883 [Amniculicola lignicola CBS 123094]|uniref:Uncharacterized protein n=1 Tax=Amniculicola lignicola CBS 123094 TaxID=1392246 RepID=A0A6A5WV85_9PLEO|nr:hypothetical protein P154DRAFT_107883 [Amniculicola lignicola CBS 123094]
MYVNDLSADSICDTALAFLVMKSEYIPIHLGGSDRTSVVRWVACLYIAVAPVDGGGAYREPGGGVAGGWSHPSREREVIHGWLPHCRGPIARQTSNFETKENTITTAGTPDYTCDPNQQSWLMSLRMIDHFISSTTLAQMPQSVHPEFDTTLAIRLLPPFPTKGAILAVNNARSSLSVPLLPSATSIPVKLRL